ncbi:MAG: phosphotransferase family protein [Pirellulaceae bacterium]
MTSQPELEGFYQQLSQDATRIVGETISGVVVGVERIPIGVMTHKFVVRLAEGHRYIVRFYPQARSFVVDYEPDLLRRCGEAGIPVPRVVVDSRTGPPAALAYVAYRMVPGVNLEGRLEFLDRSQRQAIARQLVECFTRMSTLSFEGYGELRDGYHAHCSTWKSFVHDAYHEGLAAVQKGNLLEQDLVAKLVDIGRQLDRFSTSDSRTLLWGDVRPQNILVDAGDRFACLLDFEGCLAGDPLLSLGFGYAALGDQPFFADCAEYWPGKIDWQQLYFYSVLRLLRIAKYAHMPLPTGRSREGLREVLPGFKSALDALEN